MTDRPARQNPQILITGLGSLLGTHLAQSLLLSNCQVFGITSSHVDRTLLKNRDFTLLELDLSQPKPQYLPDFDIIFDLSPLERGGQSMSLPQLSPQTRNIIAAAKGDCQMIVFAPISTS